MDRLFSPWRYQYVSTSAPSSGCVFCSAESSSDEDALIVHRARLSYVIVNRYPYTSGHLMVVPFRHAATLHECTVEEARELMDLTRAGEQVLQDVYRAPGINIGMNVGACAGAGVAGHLHMHLLPRWPGDANFLSTVGETRVLPEDLGQTWTKLRAAWPASC
ncbi:MAG: HIT domain-containing protein [Bryobacteraceae bacterium]